MGFVCGAKVEPGTSYDTVFLELEEEAKLDFGGLKLEPGKPGPGAPLLLE